MSVDFTKHIPDLNSRCLISPSIRDDWLDTFQTPCEFWRRFEYCEVCDNFSFCFPLIGKCR